jgi:hypothetical protein
MEQLGTAAGFEGGECILGMRNCLEAEKGWSGQHHAGQPLPKALLGIFADRVRPEVDVQ